MDMPDVHHIAIYGDLIAAKVQGRAASSEHHWLAKFNNIGESINSHFSCIPSKRHINSRYPQESTLTM